MTQKISGKTTMAATVVDVDRSVSHPSFLCPPFSRSDSGPVVRPRRTAGGWAFGGLSGIPKVGPPQRPCVGRWKRLCFVQHGVAMCVTSPLVIPPDGGLYHGYHLVTLGWCLFASELSCGLPFVTTSTRTCFLIHLVQRSVGWRLAGFLFLPVTLLSDCRSFNCFDFCVSPLFIHHCILTEFFFLRMVAARLALVYR